LTQCVKLDRETFSDRRVVAALSRFVPIEVDLTHASRTDERLVNEHMVLAFPVLLVLDPQGKALPETRIDGFVKPDALLDVLEKVPQEEDSGGGEGENS
jgi:thiol:disulfide interchange protein DsbD